MHNFILDAVLPSIDSDYQNTSTLACNTNERAKHANTFAIMIASQIGHQEPDQTKRLVAATQVWPHETAVNLPCEILLVVTEFSQIHIH